MTKRFITISFDNTIKVWNDDIKLLTTLYHGSVTSAVFSSHRQNNGVAINTISYASPENEKIISADSDGNIKIWDATNYKLVKTFVAHENCRLVTSL